MAVQILPCLAKGLQSCLVRPRYRRRVTDRPVELFGASRKVRAFLSGLIADRDHDIKAAVGHLLNRFRSMVRDVDADLAHDGHRQGMKACGAGSCAADLEAIARFVAEQSLGHLATGRVVGAQEEDPWLAHDPLTTNRISL